VPDRENIIQSIIMKIFVIALLLISATGVFAQQSASPSISFWNSLQSLCGKAYAGSLQNAPANDTTFTGQDLSMHVFSCQPEKIKIALSVGEDRTRTWLIYFYEDRLLLKHDHRKKDGSRDEITNYGGWTTNLGSAKKQVFPADQETFSIIPDAASNVWWIDLEPGSHFIYNLQRIGTDRFFSLKFDTSKSIPFRVVD